MIENNNEDYDSKNMEDSMSSPTVMQHYKSTQIPADKKKKVRTYSVYNRIEVD